MKLFPDCINKCCICDLNDHGCLAGIGDDNFRLASKEKIISRLSNSKYTSFAPDKSLMIDTLKDEYNYVYNEGVLKNE